MDASEYKWRKEEKHVSEGEVALISETSNRPRRRQPPTYSLQCLSLSLILTLIWQISDLKFSLPEGMIQISLSCLEFARHVERPCAGMKCLIRFEWHQVV